MIFIWKLLEKIQPYFVITYHDTRNMRATSLKITPYFASQKKKKQKKNTKHQHHHVLKVIIYR